MDGGRDWSEEIGVLIGQLTRYYVLPDVAARVCDMLRQRLADGAYGGLADEEALAAVVTVDLQSVNGDKHLFLESRAGEIPERADPVVPDAGRDPRRRELTGHGFARVDRLPGNVGLLDIRRLYDPVASGASAIAAMNLVAGADVLLIDLRANGGGEPEMVVLLCSYLFDERTQLSTLHFPGDDRSVQYWTTFAPGPRFGGSKPVYVLTSGNTISGGEGLSYDLQQAGRATVVGETTAGAANFHFPYRVSAHLVSGVPSGYPINPVSGANWESVGVRPDLAVPAEQAFDSAYRLALGHVLALGAEGARRQVVEEARRALAELEARPSEREAALPPGPTG